MGRGTDELVQGQIYTTALCTAREVLDSLRDLPDPDGALAALIQRIERQRAWLTTEVRLGLTPQPAPLWLDRERSPVTR